MRIYINVIFPDCSYSEGLAKAGFTTLYDRRSTLCKELFSVIVTQGNHKLSHLLLVRSQQNYNLRSTHAFAAPVCKTNRFRDSFIISHCMQYILNSRYIFIVNTQVYDPSLEQGVTDPLPRSPIKLEQSRALS